MVSAWAPENGLVLGQVKVDEKSNGITAVPELLRRLELAGSIVTLDATGCQKEIAEKIVDAEADYCPALKANHSTLSQPCISCVFQRAAVAGDEYFFARRRPM